MISPYFLDLFRLESYRFYNLLLIFRRGDNALCVQLEDFSDLINLLSSAAKVKSGNVYSAPVEAGALLILIHSRTTKSNRSRVNRPSLGNGPMWTKMVRSQTSIGSDPFGNGLV